MVNFSFNMASMTGIVMAVAGVALYAVRSFRPELSRDHDIFFSAVCLLCGLILVFYGWRFDPIMQFGQVLLSSAAVFFALENLRLRRITTTQAKRGTPAAAVDYDRPVSRVYRAELDDLEPEEEEEPQPRVRTRVYGYEDDDYLPQERTRPSLRSRPEPSSRGYRPSESTSRAVRPARRSGSETNPRRLRASTPRRPEQDTGEYADYQPISDAYEPEDLGEQT